MKHGRIITVQDYAIELSARLLTVSDRISSAESILCVGVLCGMDHTYRMVLRPHADAFLNESPNAQISI